MEAAPTRCSYGVSLDVVDIIKQSLKFASSSVYVVTGSSLMWVVAAVQVGFSKIWVWCSTARARANLWKLKSLSEFQTVEELTEPLLSRTEFVGLVLMEDTDVETIRIWSERSRCCIAVGSKELGKQVRRADPNLKRFREVKVQHRQLSGLTTGVVSMIIFGRALKDLRILKQEFPIRPVSKFVEPSVRLDRSQLRKLNNSTPVWRASDQVPFAWRDLVWPITVAAPSVYFGGNEIIRYLTEKEAGQLLDIPETLPVEIIRMVFEWSEGVPIPLRVLVEPLMECAGWLARCQALDSPVNVRRVTELSSDRFLLSLPRPDGLEGYYGLTAFRVVHEPNKSLQAGSASKADDAAVDTAIWSVGGNAPGMEFAREVIRRGLHRWWCLKLAREIRREVAVFRLLPNDESGNARVTMEAYRECMERAMNSTWWEWADGSRLNFWRWPACWRKEALEGVKVPHIADIPKRRVARTMAFEPDRRELVMAKLKKLIERRYVVGEDRPMSVVSSIPYMEVLKPPKDIRVVWSSTETGVNPALYAWRLFLPTPDSLFRRVPIGGWMGDMDSGEMFNNFTMHHSETVYNGVNIPEDLQKECGVPRFCRWARLYFGWRPAPVLAARMFLRALEVVKRLPSDSTSAFRWATVRLNLPMSEEYDPGQLWVVKLRSDGEVACDELTFIDDLRPFGPNREIVKQAVRQAASGVQRHGIQETARKRREVSQRPGAWAGTVEYTDHDLNRKFLVQKKWDRAKEDLGWILRCIDENEGLLPAVEFDRKRGFMTHVTGTYDDGKPYMKGLHLTAFGHYDGRDEFGWKHLPPKERKNKRAVEDEQDRAQSSFEFEVVALAKNYENDEVPELPSSPGRPESYQAVPRLRDDVLALLRLYQSDHPAMILLYPVQGVRNLCYGFGDASGEGFGRTIRVGSSSDAILTSAVMGFWCSSVSERTSNYREARNLVEHVKESAMAGDLQGREVWMFTDNEVWESCWHNGTSTERSLFELVLQLKEVVRSGSFVLHVVHIAGTRMIAEGTDGLSRGENHAEALASSYRFRVPLHLSAREREPRLDEFFDSWLDGESQWACPEDWFWKAVQAHEYADPTLSKTWIWNPPPSAALHALEELGSGRVKRPDVLRGVFVVSKLLRPMWFRRFARVVDFYFSIPAGAKCWPGEQHETLFIGVFLPLLSCKPWDWRRVPFLVAVGRQVSALLSNEYEAGIDLLCKFWDAAIRVPTLPHDVVSRVLSDPLPYRFLSLSRKGSGVRGARSGRRRLTGAWPSVPVSMGEQYLLDFIRRANLDAFWSREPSTVADNFRLFSVEASLGRSHGYVAFPPMGPFPRDYDGGLRAALGVLAASLKKGRHESTVKFSAARKARTIHTNVYQASALGIGQSLYARTDRVRSIISRNPTDAEFFQRFIKGVEYRLGQRVKRDKAVSIAIMVEIERIAEEDWELARQQGDQSRMREVAEWGVYFSSTFCHSLRGWETVKATYRSLLTQIVTEEEAAISGGKAHFGLPLYGRFKRCGNANVEILCLIAARTNSGLCPLKWVQRLLECIEEGGGDQFWLFENDKGERLKMNDFSPMFYRVLRMIQDSADLDLIPHDEVVEEIYFLARSFRRGATTQAQLVNVAETLINWVNRWGTGTEAVVKGEMRVVYSERALMAAYYLGFSEAL